MTSTAVGSPSSAKLSGVGMALDGTFRVTPLDPEPEDGATGCPIGFPTPPPEPELFVTAAVSDDPTGCPGESFSITD